MTGRSVICHCQERSDKAISIQRIGFVFPPTLVFRPKTGQIGFVWHSVHTNGASLGWIHPCHAPLTTDTQIGFVFALTFVFKRITQTIGFVSQNWVCFE
jgi:hypothetical protein